MLSALGFENELDPKFSNCSVAKPISSAHPKRHLKEFLVDVWESRNFKLYGENKCPGPQPNSSGWDLGQDSKLWNGRNGRSGKLSHSSDEIGECICSNVELHACVCGSTHCGCVVNGSVAMAAA